MSRADESPQWTELQAPSPSGHLERVLDRLAVVGVGTAIGGPHPQPEIPPAFPTASGRRTAGLGLGLRNLPSPVLSRSLWVLNAKDWGRASHLALGPYRGQISSTVRASSLLHTHKHSPTHTLSRTSV